MFGTLENKDQFKKKTENKRVKENFLLGRGTTIEKY